MTFRIREYSLPHEGIIPGARGHKKIVIPRGTKVYCITHGHKLFWAAYLNESDAAKCMTGLTDSINGKARRQMTLDTMLAWNFKSTIPSRIARPKAKANAQ